MIRGSNGEAERGPNSTLPEYESNSPEPGIPPPDYRDALQDVIVSSGPTVTVRSLHSKTSSGMEIMAFSGSLWGNFSPKNLTFTPKDFFGGEIA